MISPHLYKIKRTSNYDFLNRASFYRLDWNERNYPFSKQIIKNLKIYNWQESELIICEKPEKK